MSLLLLLSLPVFSAASPLPLAFHQAAKQHGVPEPLLLALSYEASRWRPDAASAWGGYGLFDLREEGSPGLEMASMAAGLSPDAVMASPELQVQAAAALLASHARRLNAGQAPPVDDLLAWWDATRAFSGSHDPTLQDRYAESLYATLNFGVPVDPESGLSIAAQPVDSWDRVPEAPPTACDYSGCNSFTAASSSNYTNQSRTAADITHVVVHTVQGSYSGCISWFQNSSASVSAHYVVRSSDGQVTQMVHEEDKAWHVGTENPYTVGIEHEGYVDDPGRWYTEAMYQASAMLTADIADRNGIPISRTYIVGHVELPNQTHTDPGSGWDWDHYMDLVNSFSSGGSAAGNIIGVVADGDIYSGARLPGAFVWVEQTGETGATASDGYYRFYDLALGSYTVHACMDGFAEGTCSKDIGTGDNWCSIALEPGDGSCSFGSTDPGDDTGEPVDTGQTDGDDGGDGADGEEPEPTPQPDDSSFRPNPPGLPPGNRVAVGETGGCTQASPRRAADGARAAALGRGPGPAAPRGLSVRPGAAAGAARRPRGPQISMKACRLSAQGVWRSLRMAFSSIWRMRSRVRLKRVPISSRL